MKKNLMCLILAMLLVVSLVMVGCAGNEAPEATTEVVMAATEAAPTEPAETKPAFVPERYEPTLPPEPTVPETVATEPTEAVEEEDDYYYEEDNSGSNYTPAPETPAETTPPATEAPAPVETTPPETEAPAVSFNYAAAGNYGDSYAASTYGWVIDYSLNSDNAGYYPAATRSVDYYINNGGQAQINADIATAVDLTASSLGGGVYGVSCCVWESGGWVYFVVYYG